MPGLEIGHEVHILHLSSTPRRQRGAGWELHLREEELRRFMGVPVYIGQGDLSKRATADHHRIRCIDSKGATHVHLHLNSKKDARIAEEQDLLANYLNALTPDGLQCESNRVR